MSDSLIFGYGDETSDVLPMIVANPMYFVGLVPEPIRAVTTNNRLRSIQADPAGYAKRFSDPNAAGTIASIMNAVDQTYTTVPLFIRSQLFTYYAQAKGWGEMQRIESIGTEYFVTKQESEVDPIKRAEFFADLSRMRVSRHITLRVLKSIKSFVFPVTDVRYSLEPAVHDLAHIVQTGMPLFFKAVVPDLALRMDDLAILFPGYPKAELIGLFPRWCSSEYYETSCEGCKTLHGIDLDTNLREKLQKK